MATISENLQTLKTSVSAIKQAISDRGGDVSGDISTWAVSIENMEGGGSSGGGAYAEVNHGTSDTTFTLTPNTFHIWDEVSSLILTLGDERSGVANEFLFQFTSGATATSLMLPDSIKWVGGSAPIIKPNMIYQISILNDLGTVLEFDNAPDLIENIGVYNEGSFMSGATLTFQYPLASDITLTVQVHGPRNIILNAGETTFTIDWDEPSAPVIVGIAPQEDSTYRYIVQ